MSSKRLKIVIWREPEKPPITLTIAIPEDLAKEIEQSQVKATTLMVMEHTAVPGIRLGGELDKYKLGG